MFNIFEKENIRFIDFHTHTFPEKIAYRALEKMSDDANILYYTDGTVKGLTDSMSVAGLDVSIVLPVVTAPRQCQSINEFAIETNEKYEQLLSFGGIHPDCVDYKEILHGLKEQGIKGIKIHPLYQNTPIDDIRYLHIIDYASELGLVIVMHAGEDLSVPGDFAYPKRIKRMLDQVKPNKMVLAHMGSYACWDEVEELLYDYPVWFDTSFAVVPVRKKHSGGPAIPQQQMQKEAFRRIITKHGIERILFASDSPWSDQLETKTIIEELLNDKEAEAIFYKNAVKLLQ